MKAIHVIRREYLESVRTKSFIISTILVPVFMAAFFVIPLLFTLFSPDKHYNVAVVDATGEIAAPFAAVLTDTLEGGERQFDVQVDDATGDRFQAEKERWLGKLRDGDVDMVLVVDNSVLDDGRVKYVTREERSFQILDQFENALTDVVIRARLARAGLDYDQVKQLATSVHLDVNQITAAGDVEERSPLSEWGVVFVFVMVLYTALLTWGIGISRGIVEEKGSRVMEVLVSSIRPRDLLFGKVVGLGLAGLTQMLVWGAFGLILSLYTASATAEVMANIRIEPVVFLYFILFFVLGFLFYASVFTVIGSISSTEQDAQQLQGMVTMPMIIPIVVLMFIVQSPNSPFAVALSLFPPFTPMVMLARVILLEPPLWQILLSLALLAASIYWAIGFSARVFRVGILMYGKRPNLRELIRWYRLAK